MGLKAFQDLDLPGEVAITPAAVHVVHDAKLAAVGAAARHFEEKCAPEMIVLGQDGGVAGIIVQGFQGKTGKTDFVILLMDQGHVDVGQGRELFENRIARLPSRRGDNLGEAFHHRFAFSQHDDVGKAFEQAGIGSRRHAAHDQYGSAVAAVFGQRLHTAPQQHLDQVKNIKFERIGGSEKGEAEERGLIFNAAGFASLGIKQNAFGGYAGVLEQAVNLLKSQAGHAHRVTIGIDQPQGSMRRRRICEKMFFGSDQVEKSHRFSFFILNRSDSFSISRHGAISLSLPRVKEEVQSWVVRAVRLRIGDFGLRIAN